MAPANKLDWLSRFELGTISLLAGMVVFGTPSVLAYFAIERFSPAEWPSAIRYGIAAAGAVVVFVLALPTALVVEDVFSAVRRLMGKPSLDEVIARTERANRGNRFVAELTSEESQRQRRAAYSWVAPYQLVAAAVLVPIFMHHSQTADGWSGPAAGLGGVVVAYAIISELMRRIERFKADQRQELEALRRQLAAFVCAAQEGAVERQELVRLREAAEGWRPKSATDYPRDDWTLISRAWKFWRDGFDEQDSTRCANCGLERRRHSAKGMCPRLDAANGN